jgi:hypothetical protein
MSRQPVHHNKNMHGQSPNKRVHKLQQIHTQRLYNSYVHVIIKCMCMCVCIYIHKISENKNELCLIGWMSNMYSKSKVTHFKM